MLGSGFRIQGLMHLGFSVFRVSGLVGQGLGLVEVNFQFWEVFAGLVRHDLPCLGHVAVVCRIADFSRCPIRSLAEW